MGDELLRAFVQERGGACPSCGYDLAGLTGDRCPECGEGLVLRIGIVEPRVGFFVLGLIGFACGLGFSLTMLGLAVYTMIVDPMYGPSFREVLPLIVGFALSGVGTIFWVARRGRIRRRARVARLAMAASGWVIWVLALFWFVQVFA